MKTFEKKVMRYIFSNRIKTNMIFVGYINGLEYFGNSYFFGRLADNFFDKKKFKEVNLSRIVKNYMINPEDEKLINPNYNITKGDNRLVLANFKISYDNDNRVSTEVSCDYHYFKLFEKDVFYILDTKGMICLYDENKSLIGVIAKVVNH